MGHVAAGTSIIEAFKEHGYPSAEECESIRLKAIAEDATFEAESRERMELTIDEVIAFLQTNRTHIAGLSIVAVPYHNDKVIEADYTATDGRSQMSVASSDYKDVLYGHLRHRLGTSNRPSNPFEALLGGLR